MGRRVHAVTGVVALVGGGGSLLLANDVTSGAAHRGAMVVLFLSFLSATLTLLWIGAASVDRIAEDELVTATLGTRRRPIRTAMGRVTRRAATSTGSAVAWAARSSSAGALQLRDAARTTVDDLRRARTDARRRELRDPRGMLDTLRRAGHATLVALGLPPEDDHVPPRPWMSQPLVQARPAHTVGPRWVASYQRRTRADARASGRRA